MCQSSAEGDTSLLFVSCLLPSLLSPRLPPFSSFPSIILVLLPFFVSLPSTFLSCLLPFFPSSSFSLTGCSLFLHTYSLSCLLLSFPNTTFLSIYSPFFSFFCSFFFFLRLCQPDRSTSCNSRLKSFDTLEASQYP